MSSDKRYLSQSFTMLKDALPIFAHAPRILCTKKGRILLSIVLEWKKRYLDIQDGVRQKQEFYYVHTPLDDKIPFVPEECRDYNMIIVQLAKIANRIAKHADLEYVQRVFDCFVYNTDISKEVFQGCPTLMPRHIEHDDLNLKIVQRYDQPVNCCPSLHIAFSLLGYNVGKPYLGEEELAEVQETVGNMANSVLYTKQHALVDISFGILAARMAFERCFPGQEFEDFTGRYTLMKERYPEIAYDEILRLYRRCIELKEEGMKLVDIVRTCLNENGYRKVKAEEVVEVGK